MVLCRASLGRYLCFFFGFSLSFVIGCFPVFLLQVLRINEALSSPAATDSGAQERCYRLTLETPPIGRSTLGKELDLLWQRYGVEYRVEGVFDHPAEMPSLMDPVVDHRLVRRLPPVPSSSSSENTGETSRAQEAPDDDSVASSAATPDTIFECFASAAPPF